MTEEPLFEVWVNGVPVLGGDGLAVLYDHVTARVRVALERGAGRRAVTVPDQSKRPPDHELLQDR